MIQEGKLSKIKRGWAEPDLFVLKGDRLISVIGVIVKDGSEFGQTPMLTN